MRRSTASSVIAAVAKGVTVGRHVIPGRWALLSGDELNVALASVLQLLGVDGEADLDELNGPPRGSPRRSGLRLEGVGGDGADGAARHRAGHEPGARLARGARGGRRAERRARSPAATRSAGGARGSSRPAAASAARPCARVKEERLGPIEWSPVQEATARGAAAMAGIGAGVFGSVDDVPAAGVRRPRTALPSRRAR